MKHKQTPVTVMRANLNLNLYISKSHGSNSSYVHTKSDAAAEAGGYFIT